MIRANRRTIYLSDYALALGEQLQDDLGCTSISEMSEWLILCQKHSVVDARALLSQRSKRGRRWPVVKPDDSVLPPSRIG